MSMLCFSYPTPMPLISSPDVVAVSNDDLVLILLLTLMFQNQREEFGLITKMLSMMATMTVI